MEVTLNRVDDTFHFVGENPQGIQVHLDDATSRPDGVGLGMSPMQLLLISLGGCSGVDLASILGKGRQKVDALRIEVRGDKPDGVAPSLFNAVHVTFRVDGEVDPDRVKRAVDLSLGKYCSVSKTLEPTATITATYVVNGTAYEWEPAG
ncbi:MAG: OsmC family protein [Rhodothermales bacterium]|nr:OsmC family protein [Rhodothermales bacterium]